MIGHDRHRWCFPTRGITAVQVALAAQTTLRVDAATALGRLIPILGCGEEAAALAFEGLARAGDADQAAAAALRQVAAEERVHDALMHALAAAVPQSHDETAIRAARRMHVQLSDGGFLAHLARIAALDAAVCSIFSRLLRPGRPLARCPVVAPVLSRIRRDEARHVTLARSAVLAHGPSPRLRTFGADARTALAEVLEIEGAAFDALHVDPDTLVRDIARLPDGLLAA